MTTICHGAIRANPSPHGPVPVAPGLLPHLDQLCKCLDFLKASGQEWRRVDEGGEEELQQLLNRLEQLHHLSREGFERPAF